MSRRSVLIRRGARQRNFSASETGNVAQYLAERKRAAKDTPEKQTRNPQRRNSWWAR